MKGKISIPDRKSLVISLFLLAGGMSIAGALFIGAGLAPISASASHWPITRWFLELSMREAVETRSREHEMPQFKNRQGELVRAAGHYASGCSPCHGAPGHTQSLTVLHMTPRAPLLAAKIREWQPAELFWIVKHGLKYTAMPAWSTMNRDDEVWGMVTFLLQLPTLSPQQFNQLAYGVEDRDATLLTPLQELTDAEDDLLAECIRCHDMDGAARRGEGIIPRLDGQKLSYLVQSLEAFASGRRHSGIMQPVAAVLDTRRMTIVSRYFSRRRAVSVITAVSDAGSIERGSRIAHVGEPADRIPACRHCHGPAGAATNDHYPRLAGQYADYLEMQLRLFRERRRGGTDYALIMQQIAVHLDDEQIRDIAHYYASLDSD